MSNNGGLSSKPKKGTKRLNSGDSPPASEMPGDQESKKVRPGSKGLGYKKRKKSRVEGQDLPPQEETATVTREAESSQGRQWTVSMAVAGSIIENAQSLELATCLAGQVARAAAIFCVDEIVVFEDGDEQSGSRLGRRQRWRGNVEPKPGEPAETGAVFLARVLQYCETPQYLRRALIPMHPLLRFAGLLPPLDAPHHARANEWIPYREGVVIEDSHNKQGGSSVDVGLQKPVNIKQKVKPGVRVTVAMGPDRSALGSRLQAVSPEEPRKKASLYWGYTVRLAKGLSGVFADCPHAEGYDYTLGTSEHGEKVPSYELKLPQFRHLLVVFGGVAGLEESTELDPALQVKEAGCLYDRYLNTCPAQGSRTIRTEEAVLISLAYLQEPIKSAQGLP